MKILLIGEFSGVHNNLKKGLTALGHDVKLAADGDSYRKFEYDFQIAPYKGKFVGRLLNVLYFIVNIRKFIGYDVIQFITPFAIPYYLHFVGLTSLVFKLNKKKVYYACGTDPAFLKAKEKFNYFPFNANNSTEIPRYNNLTLYFYSWFLKNIDYLIPSMYTYGLGYQDNCKLTKPIPLPGSGKCIEQVNSNKSETIKILFGITRREFKGSKYILDALKLVKSKYGNSVELTIVEKLPFKDYIDLLNQTDILIDQCKSYDYGMNAIFALEKGKIVLSGAEPVAKNYLNVDNCPIINIMPDTQQIFNELEKLIINKNIYELQFMSLDYVRKVHDLKLVTQKFIKQYAGN